MKVLLKRTWFVEKRRYKKSVPATTPVEIPDHLRDQLPSDAVVVEDNYKAPVVEPVREPETLAELGRFNQNRSVPEELADAHIKAEAEVKAGVEAKAQVAARIEAKAQADAKAEAEVSGQWPIEKKDEPDA